MPFGSFEVSADQMILHPRWERNLTTANFDLALLKVSTRPPNGRYFRLEALRLTPASGIAICGYAAKRAAGVDPNDQNIDLDTIRDLHGESFTYSANTLPGTSGSPAFYVIDSEVRAIGVHSRAFDRHKNRGCRLTDAKISWTSSLADEGMRTEIELQTTEDPQPTIDLARDDQGLTTDGDVEMEYIPSFSEDGEVAGLDELTKLGAFDVGDFDDIGIDD